MERAGLFKAYDIRGLSPQELNADLAFLVGQAMARFIEAKTIAVGRDARITSPTLFAAFADGAMSQGANVVDIGEITTPMHYFAVANYAHHDSGAMITASHNPAKYNGVKLCVGDAMPIGAETGMQHIRDIALAGPYPDAAARGTMSALDVKQDYLDLLFSKVNVSRIVGLNVAIDAGNGMAGPVVRDIFARLPGCEMTGLYMDVDCAFPNHEANPLNESTLDELKALIRKAGASVGFAFDGDGDRIGIVDDNGETLRGDQILALLVPRVLAMHTKAAVLYDVSSGMVVAEEISRAGGKPVLSPVGHGLIKPRMRKEDAAFAGELSYHFYFKDFFGVDCPDLVMLLVLELLAETGRPLSDLVAPLRRYHHSGEINSEVANKDAVIAAVEATYASHATSVSHIDGIRMDFRDPAAPEDDWWLTVRASNTEPLLRLTLEAKRKETMETRRDELLKIIRG